MEEAVASGYEVKDLWARPLLAIEEKMTAEGRPVPWEVGPCSCIAHQADANCYIHFTFDSAGIVLNV